MCRSLLAAAALLLACGPLPCKYPEVHAELAEVADPPAAGDYFAAVSLGDLFVVAGADGHVLRARILKRHGYDPAGVRYSEEVIASGTTATLRGLAHVPGGDMYAVGDGGTVRISADEGRTWRASESGTTADLHAVASVGTPGGTSTTIIVGDGVVLRSTDDGASWTTATLPGGDEALRGVTYRRSRGWLAVGRDGVIVRSTDDGLTWKPDPSPTTGDLLRFYGEDGELTYLVGVDGFWASGYDGWEPVDLPFTGEVADVSPFTVVMRDGRVAHRDFPDQTFRPATIDAKFRFARIVEEPLHESKAIFLTADGELVFAEFLIVDRHSNKECWAMDVY